MMRFFYSILLCVYASVTLGQDKVINMITELEKLTNIHQLPTYMENATVKQFSSYDTTGGNDDGFSGKYSFISRNPDSSLVLFEVKEAGAINRIWTPTPNSDTLDFYFDDEKEPSFSIRFEDLFSGKVYPFVAPLTGNEIGGYYSYVPIPFKKGCKIVSRGKAMQFYQIQYSTFGQDKVETFRAELSEREKLGIDAVGNQWNEIEQLSTDAQVIHTDTALTPGQSITLANMQEGGRIVAVKIWPAQNFTGLQKQIDLKITWDDEKIPAVYMPMADFFGYAFGTVSMQSLLLGTANNVNYSYFPMPYDSNARIELIYRLPNEGEGVIEPINVKADILVDNKRRDKEKEGKFYTYWNRNKDAPLGEPHIFLKGKGKGHYVGTLQQAQGLNPGMTLFFEGDDVTVIDGEQRIHGTGSEDYYNGGWYALLDRWDRKMSLPLHGSLDYSLPFARTGGYRLFLSDKMPFNKEILHTIEHGPEENNIPVDYTSVALYYADAPVHSQITAPGNALTNVYIPDTMMVYPQLMRYSVAGRVKIDGNLLQTTTGGQVKIDLSELPKGSYKLYADIEKVPEGAEITVWQRQKQVSQPISFYSEMKNTEQHSYFCEIELDDFKDAITLHFKKEESRSRAIVERLILVRNR
ncbi:DUF2961 domain-containing protein [Olivibacter sp. SDN3]|uniref:glycoside hydrolase family 172 protein n=1 Tax=Olivibacter sp. SDN3 TaxID=2764720 RepID=UPI00165191F2|nr:glycoside hydrolase family 172 protein [Olivibacter sp. SDN3]QNL49365.1 DUF2961 domain-containing protein [Olivibacter sp. SDN3]